MTRPPRCPVLQPGLGVAGVGANFHPKLDDLEFRLVPGHTRIPPVCWYTSTHTIFHIPPPRMRWQGVVQRSTLPHLLEYLRDHAEAVIHGRCVVGEGHEVIGRALEQQAPRRAPTGNCSSNVFVWVVEKAHFRDAADAHDEVRILVL